jgi:hypothetical protein
MKTAVRILVTATTLAALTMLSLAATATATVPQRDERTQHPTTIEPTTVPHPGHGVQVDREDATPAAGSQPPTDRTSDAVYPFAPSIPTLAAILLGLLLALARATWLRRRHRPPAAV